MLLTVFMIDLELNTRNYQKGAAVDCLTSSSRFICRLMESMLEEVDQTRRLSGLSVEKLAPNVGVHLNTLFRVLNGRVDPLIIEMNRVYLFLRAHGVLLRKGGFRLKGMKAS